MSKKRRKKNKVRAAASSNTSAKASAPAKAPEESPKLETSNTADARWNALPSSGPLDRYLFGALSPARVFLMLRGLLMLLAFDCWVDLIPHGGRYGVGDFNVAHFAWLDAVLPVPTPALYVGTMLFTGLVAFTMALVPRRPGLVVLFLSYTLAWAMSMLDSYQHHYLISLLLFSAIFFPLPSARELFDTKKSERRPADRAGAFAYVLGLYELLAWMVELPNLVDALGLGVSAAFGLRATLLLYGVLGPSMLGSQDVTRPRTSAWGYVSFTVTCAIVYFYTAVTKLSPDWRDGHALQRLGANSEIFRDIESVAASGTYFEAMTPSDFWSLAAKGAIAVQLASFAAFMLASTIDRRSLKGAAFVSLLGFAPLSFHVGVEQMGLHIGWFSYFMLWVAVVAFSPRPSLDAAAELLSWPFRRVANLLRSTKDREPLFIGGRIAAASLVVVLTLQRIDLPGSTSAALYGCALLFFAFVYAMRSGRASVLGQLAGLDVALLVASLCAFVATTETQARYDYYRFVGGDHRRRGEYPEALDAYEKANRYIVTPWCVYEGRERLDCYRSEERAREEAGATRRVERSDRQEQEDEMRRRVEGGA